MNDYPHERSAASLWRRGAFLSLASLLSAASQAQTEGEDETLFELSPFEVTADDDVGYRATHTLAGTRIRTDLRDIGSAISVVTKDFLDDTAATGSNSLLVYTTGTEVAGPEGNFGGAGNGPVLNESFQSSARDTRVRGLASANNTIDFHLTNIPWDSYNVDRIDIQRGPNAILFGFGSPAGIINASRIRATKENQGEVELRFDNEGGLRGSIDVNRVILEGELSVRFAALNNRAEFRQNPAYEDDRRLFGTFQYEPKFLRSENMRTTVRGTFETGDIDSNRPRAIPPVDAITPWFRPVRLSDGSFNPEGGIGKGTFTPVQINVGEPLPGETNVGQLNSNFNDGTPNPAYIPALGTFPQSFGSIHLQFNDVGAIDRAFQTETQNITAGGRAADGSVDGSIGGLPFQRPGGVDNFPEIARKLGLPFEELGQFKNFHVTDPSIFDFWNHMLEGPNKYEKQDWDHATFSVGQTFFNNKIGYEASYDRQEYEQERFAMVPGNRAAIHVDVNSELADGSPNPNVGRPFFSGTGVFNSGGSRSTRESYRLTAFAEHDFAGSGGSEAWWRRLLGRHVATGLVSREQSESINQTWQAFGTDDAYGAQIGVADFSDNARQFSPVVYLGPSLLDRSSASEAHLTGAPALAFPDSVQTRVFDSTWNATAVDPATPWDSNGDGELNSTQSENPANYVGWTNREVNILRGAKGGRDRELLTRDITLTDDRIDSEVLVLQSFFWDGAVVGTYGWRKDENTVYRVEAADDPQTQRTRFDTLVLPDDPVNTLEVQSQSWSVAAHLNELFGLDDRLPVNLSLYYNESENFQPAAGRVNIYGQSLTSPSGTTIDRSALIATKDGRYSLRATRFTTSITNDSANVPKAWYVGQFMNRGDTAANRFEFDVAGGSVGNPNFGNTYQPRSGQTPEEAAQEEAEAVAGWRNLQQQVLNLSEQFTGDPEAFYSAWGSRSDVAPPQATPVLRPPSGFSITQDAVSSGYEFEFTARPVENWRLALNASKNDAVRSNIGGTTFLRHIELLEDALNNTAAGNLRVWNGGANSETQLGQFNRVFAGDWELTKLLEGTESPELRQWRYNLVTNYSFSDGAFKGWNVGAAYRWQDEVVIGYPLEYEESGSPRFLLDDPFFGPSESNTDLWLGYRRKLNDRVNWRVQLNARNVFSDKDLIPISAQPDGRIAGVRISPTTSWQLTNTFTF